MNEQLPCKYLASLVDLRRCRSGTNNGVRACSPQDFFPLVHNRIPVEAGGTNDANGNMGRDGGRERIQAKISSLPQGGACGESIYMYS